MFSRFAIAGFFILAVLAAVAAWIWFPWVISPGYTIRVATGPIGSDGQKFIAAFKRAVTEEHPRVRLALIETASIQASADALMDGKVDLAAARSDHPAAANGGTIVILQRLSLVVMTTPNSSIKTMKGLAGKKIAILDSTSADDPFLKTVMTFYGLKPSNIVKTSLADIGTSLRDKQVAAVITIGLVGPGTLTDVVKAIVKATKKPPNFIDLDEAKVIAAQSPVYEEVEIPKGSFDSAARIPDDDVSTLALTVRLIAKNAMLDEVAGELTRMLLSTRAKLAATVPRAAQIEVPDTNMKESLLPTHPGTAAYLNGEKASTFEQVSDLLFDFSIVGGILGSLAIGLGGLWRRHRPDETQKNLARLPGILHEVRLASPDQLEVIETELDTLTEWLLDRVANEQIAADRINGVALTISQVRLQIERRRKAGQETTASQKDRHSHA